MPQRRGRAAILGRVIHGCAWVGSAHVDTERLARRHTQGRRRCLLQRYPAQRASSQGAWFPLGRIPGKLADRNYVFLLMHFNVKKRVPMLRQSFPGRFIPYTKGGLKLGCFH